ncbi:MAG TPA: glycosyltransferase family 4 protein [Mycobacteriales bacterium]|nr:glycosyltransferase family 4 protein [Mycobacteriales bacterium]
MNVLMLSWEYPPLVVGGLGRHVHALATSLVQAGHAVVVISRDHPDAPPDTVVEGVRVVRVIEDPPLVPFEELLAWVMALNHGLVRAALMVAEDFAPDVIHAHDWLVAHAAKTLKDHTGAPVVATVHATEAGRHQGHLPGPLNRAVHSVEWWLTYEARRVITCSTYMREEVVRLFALPPQKVDVVPNGIDLEHWSADTHAVAALRQRLSSTGAPVLLYAGRLEYEKGVQTVLAALPRLRRRHPGLRLVIAGVGTRTEELHALARTLRVSRAITFMGFLEPADLAVVAAAADCAVVPSIYEPFGMVALECAAAGTPIVVADTGGLREFVTHDMTGLRFPPGDQGALADAVTRLLGDEVLGQRLVRDARTLLVRDYTWAAIAHRTAAVFELAVREERAMRAGFVAEAKVPLRVLYGRSALLSGTDER